MKNNNIERQLEKTPPLCFGMYDPTCKDSRKQNKKT